MRRKVFRGRDLREALARVRSALGPDAVIFATRRMEPDEDPTGAFDEPYFEVEAAEWLSVDEPAGGEDAPAPGHSEGEGSRRAARPRASAARAAAVGAVRDALFAELCRSGLGEVTAEEILARAVEGRPRAEAESFGALRERVAEILTFLFEAAEPLRPAEGGGGPTVVNFIGPTGVGKTSTIAKIAAVCTTRRRWRVGLIGVDSPRVGALEPLKAYAAMMRLPFVGVRTVEELDAALRKFQRADLVLVDTDGRSPADAARMAELARLFGEGRPGRNYLVLAANTHPADMARMGEGFSRVPLHGLVFTKLDESSRFGVIFERHMELGVPVAYFTTGQRVPQDLEAASAARMARLILPESPVAAAAGTTA